MILGLDYLGGAKYGDLIQREHPAGWAAGFFANTFGNAWPVIEKLVDSGRCPRIRIHAVWDDAHQYRPAEHDKVIMRELKKACDLRLRNLAVDVMFSPFCEHNIKGRQLEQLIQKCKPMAADAGVALVNSVFRGDLLPLDQAINEVHGTHPKPKGTYFYSFDGLSAVDADVEKIKEQYSDARTFFYWVPQFNLRKNLNDTTPRPQRKAVPTSGLIDSVIYLHRDKGEAKLDKKHLWKSHADQHSVPLPEPRAHKPVFISPVDCKRIELVADNGQVVAVMPRTSNFTDGRPLYRLPEYGFLVAEKAKRIHGKPTVKLIANGKLLGVVNPAFRDGSWR
jgi:hypothetical protein